MYLLKVAQQTFCVQERLSKNKRHNESHVSVKIKKNMREISRVARACER